MDEELKDYVILKPLKNNISLLSNKFRFWVTSIQKEVTKIF